MSACERNCDGLSWNNRTFYVTASVPYSCEAARGVARCEYITPEPIDIQAVWRSTVKSPMTEIVKPILLIVTAIVALGSIVARADAIDTEHLFGFTIGTDIGEVGEKEFESNTLSRLGKRAGSYSALSQSLSLEYTAVQNLRLEVSATGVYYDIVGVPGLDDRRQGAFDGLSFDMRYRILDRAHAPFGLMIDAEPHWGRVDEVSGEPVDRYGVDLALVADKELVPNRIVAAFNPLYLPEIAHSRVTGIWSRQATIGVATALMAQIGPDLFVGTEVDIFAATKD